MNKKIILTLTVAILCACVFGAIKWRPDTAPTIPATGWVQILESRMPGVFNVEDRYFLIVNTDASVSYRVAIQEDEPTTSDAGFVLGPRGSTPDGGGRFELSGCRSAVWASQVGGSTPLSTLKVQEAY